MDTHTLNFFKDTVGILLVPIDAALANEAKAISLSRWLLIAKGELANMQAMPAPFSKPTPLCTASLLSGFPIAVRKLMNIPLHIRSLWACGVLSNAQPLVSRPRPVAGCLTPWKLIPLLTANGPPSAAQTVNPLNTNRPLPTRIGWPLN